jgi:hypothetical protein
MWSVSLEKGLLHFKDVSIQNILGNIYLDTVVMTDCLLGPSQLCGTLIQFTLQLLIPQHDVKSASKNLSQGGGGGGAGAWFQL